MGSLITGIGYIGAQLAEQLLVSGEQVVGLDNLFSSDLAAIEGLARHPHFTFIRGDVRNEEDMRRAFGQERIDTVYHLAAQSSANPAAATARYTEETNLIGSRVVFEEASRAGAGTVVFGSSLQVYGRRVEGIVDETSPYGPILDLSHLSKVHVEKLLEMFSVTHGLRAVSARIGLVYGRGPLMKTNPMFMTAPNKFCLQAVTHETIRIDSGAYFPTGMIHVADATAGMIALARAAAEGHRAVNLPGETASVAEVSDIVARLGSRRGLEVKVERPSEPPAVTWVEFRSSAERYGFRRTRSLEGGLEELLDHFTDNPGSREPGNPAGLNDHEARP